MCRFCSEIEPLSVAASLCREKTFSSFLYHICLRKFFLFFLIFTPSGANFIWWIFVILCSFFFFLQQEWLLVKKDHFICNITASKKLTSNSNATDILVCLLPSIAPQFLQHIHPLPWKELTLTSPAVSPALSGWLKRDGGVLLGAGMLGIPRAPTRSKQAKRSKLQLSSKQAQHPLFISVEILMHVMKGLK